MFSKECQKTIFSAADLTTYNMGEKMAEILKFLLNLFGNHLLSVSQFLQTTGEQKPMLLVQIDEPFINIFSNKKAIPAILKDKTDFPIYIITTRETATFAENFPMELLHIKNRYTKLYGDDPIAKMSVDFDNLYNAASTSLQGILMHLRTAYLSANYDDLFVAELMNKIYTILESALYLRSQSIPVGLCEIIFKIENSYNPQNSVLSKIAKKIESGDIKGIAEYTFELLLNLEEILGQIKGITEE